MILYLLYILLTNSAAIAALDGSIDLACGMLTTCGGCRARTDCTWCFIARGQPRCDPVHHLHRRGNECISPLFDDGRGDHADACNSRWQLLGNMNWDNSASSNPTHPIGLVLQAPTFGQRIIGRNAIRPLIELTLIKAGTQLEQHDELCFWVHQATKPIHEVYQDITRVLPPAACDDQQKILSGVLSTLDVPKDVGSYIIAVQVRTSTTKEPRSGVAYTLIDRYPVEVHEWGNLFRENYLMPTRWWKERVDHDSSSSGDNLGSLVLYHNRFTSTSKHIATMPLSTTKSKPRRIPKIMHQIWTGGTDELKRFNLELNDGDKRKWFLTWRKTCLLQHPKEKGWIHYFWDLISMRVFVAKHFPAMLEQYDHMDLDIKRTDLFRMLVLLVHGGTYVDIDFECLRPLDETIIRYVKEPLNVTIRRIGRASDNDLSDGTITMVIDSKDHVISPWLYLSEHKTNLPMNHILKGRELPNAFMASITWHPLIWLVTIEMLRRDALHPGGYVTHTTGPHVFSQIVFGYLETYGGANVHILPIVDLFPVDCLDKEMMKKDAACIQHGNCLEIYPKSSAVHHYAASWYPAAEKKLGL